MATKRTPAEIAKTRRARALPKQTSAEALAVARRFLERADTAKKMLRKIKNAPVAPDILTTWPQSASKKRRLEIITAKLGALRDLKAYGLAVSRHDKLAITEKGRQALAPKPKSGSPKAKTSQRKSPPKRKSSSSSPKKKTAKAPREMKKRGYTVERCTTRRSNHATLEEARKAATRKRNAKIRSAKTGRFAKKES